MPPKCIFCRIAANQLNAKFVFEDPEVVAFQDINPQAPVHILVVPRVHIPSLREVDIPHMGLLGKMVLIAKDLAKKLNVDETGFRLAVNNGRDAGQEVDHLHVHLLAGRKMNWPPG